VSWIKRLDLTWFERGGVSWQQKSVLHSTGGAAISQVCILVMHVYLSTSTGECWATCWIGASTTPCASKGSCSSMMH
jgi:hypothetical protein